MRNVRLAVKTSGCTVNYRAIVTMKNELNQRCIIDMDAVLPTEREQAVYVLVDSKSQIIPV